jgi:uncharacterized membrane protein YkoI
MKTQILTSIAVVGLLAGCTRSNVEQASNEFNQLPPAVQKTVRAQAPDAEIADIKKDSRNGREVYVVQFRDKQRHPAMEVAADGMLVKYQAGEAAMGSPGSVEGSVKGRVATSMEKEYSALPVTVQKAIDANAPKAEVADIKRKEENGQVIYDIEYAGKDHKPVLRISADGHIMKKPDEADPKTVK